MTSRLELALFACWMLVLVWAPLPFASNRVWGAALLALLVAGILIAWLGLHLAGRVRMLEQVWCHGRWPLLLLLLVQVWVLFQTLPLPRPLVETLSPQAYAWHIREGRLTLSLDPEITRFYLLRGCTYTAGFFLTLALVNSHLRVKVLLQVLVFSGTFQAAYGALMVLSGLELGFFVEKYASLGSATGTFVNRNHLAGYLNMTLAAGIGLLMSQWTSSVVPGWKERLRRWLRLLLSPKVRLRIYLLVMVLALVLTRSRTGNIAFFIALGVAAVLAVYAGRRFSWRAVVFFSSFFVVDMLLLGHWFGFDRLLQRIGETDPGSEARVWSNEYTLDIIEKFPLTGTGGGSFYGIFPNFQDAALQGFHLHAHNDYLEFAADLGLPATAVLFAFAILAFYSACRVQIDRRTPLYRGAGFAVSMTLVWAALHSLTDFNLQIPANALTFVTLAALAFVCRGLPAMNGEGNDPVR